MTQRLKDKPARATGSPPPAAASAGQTDNASGPAVRPPPGWVTVLTCLLLALAVWAVFGQTRQHEFVNFDDDKYVYENSTVTQGLTLSGIVWAFTHRHGGNWHPLTSLSHMLDCQLYGLKPGGHHLTNVLLHAATGILLFLLLRKLTGAFWRSAFVAAVFCIHPLRVESVAWISERKDVLSGLFFVLTLGAYARYAQRRSKVEGRGSRAGTAIQALDSRLSTPDYALSLFCFALGLLSKPMLVTLPFVLWLLDYWPLRRIASGSRLSALDRRLIGRLFLEKIPFLLLSAAAGVATLLAQESAIQSVEKIAVLSRIGNALVAYVVYLGQMFYPVGLAVFYPHPGNQLSVWTVGWCGVVLSLITAGVVRWQRQRPYLLVGWLWYLGMLVPVIGLLQVGSQARADRYTYLPHIGLYVMVAWGAVDLCGAWRSRRVVLATAAALILTGLVVLAHAQTAHWRDSVSLWTHTLASTSGHSLAYNNLGMALGQQGKWTEAIPHFERALQLKPDNAEAHNNLGLALAQQGKWQEARPHYERALQLNPDSVQTHNNLGIALGQQGKWDEAIRHYERALQLNPDYAEAHNNLGSALGQQEKWTEAIRHCERALQLNPDSVQTHNNFGLILAAQGKWQEAMPHYERALQLKPDYAEAHNNLGLALAQQRKWSAAIPHFERMLELNPDYAEAYYSLGRAWAAQGELDAAMAYYKRALQLKPDLAGAHYNLGVALGQQGKWPEALSHYERALQLKPDFAEAHNNLGLALAEQGKWPEALPHYERALQLKPDLAEAHHNSGSALAAQGKWQEALSHYERALQLKPDYAEAHNNSGIALAAQGKWPEAMAHYERALQLKPDYAGAHNNSGIALAAQGKWPEAIRHYERALQLKPDLAEAHNNLGLALIQQGKWPEAIAHYERALQLKPDYADAGCNLAWLLATCCEAQFRHPAEALRRAQRARELTQSRSPEVLDTLAAAQAAGGDFARAVETAKQALALATAAGNSNLAREIQRHLQLYQAGQPFYEPPLDGGREKPGQP